METATEISFEPRRAGAQKLRGSGLRAALAAFLLITTGAPSSADELPIRIDSGRLDIDVIAHVGQLDFNGRRLYFGSNVSDLFGVFNPGRCNMDSPCIPGASISLDATWVGSDIRGTATLDQIEYRDVGGFNSPSSMSVRFLGSAVLPPLAASATVSAPITMTGEFRHPVAAVDALAAKGVANVFLTPSQSFPGAWRVNRVVYTFASGLQPPWWTADIGSVEPVGDAAVSEGFAPMFFVNGDGADIWGTSDAFRYVYRSFVGDGEIVARVVTQDSMHPYAKAGVMLRVTLDASSPQVILDVKPDGWLEFMVRHGSAENTAYIGGGQAAAMPWLKLVRSGDQVTASHSADGLTWSALGSTALPWMPSGIFAGLAVTSHETGRLNQAAFDNVTVSPHAHNLLMFESFEEYGPQLGPLPELGPIGWISDHALRQSPAATETNQPHSGSRNGVCWTPAYLDCGVYQEVIAPVAGSYTLRLFATADRAGGLVGANVNGSLAAYREVDARGFRNYGLAYSMSFDASAGDTIRVWMYSPAIPGYVVIDDVSLMLDRTLVVTGGEWTIGYPGPFGRLTLQGDEFAFEGSYDGGTVNPAGICEWSPPGKCVPGQVLRLFSSLVAYQPLTNASFARGRATVAGRSWSFLEFGGELHLDGVVTLPAPSATSDPEVVSVTAPFTFSGNLKGYEVLQRLVPKLVFDVPLTGRGTATLDLFSRPNAPTMWFYRIRYAFERVSMTTP